MRCGKRNEQEMEIMNYGNKSSTVDYADCQEGKRVSAAVQ